MRVATANAQDRAVDSLQRRQVGLQTAQERLVSGKRVARASDDPTSAARAERALAAQARIEASQRGLEASRSAMVQTESALGDAVNLMQRVRELTTQAGNATYADAQRGALAQEIRGLREQLLSIANRGDGAGGYLFAGQGAPTQPFIDAPGGVQFRGTRGEAQVASSEPLPLSVDGETAWLRAPTGNGVFAVEPAAANAPGAWVDSGQVTDPAAVTGDDYSVVFTSAAGGTTYAVLRNGNPTAITAEPFQSGRAITFDGISFTVKGAPATGDTFEVTASQRELSVFDTLDRLAEGLESSSQSDAQLTQIVQSGLRDVDSTMGGLISLRSRLGGILNRVDTVESRLAETKVLAQTDRSIAEDLDMVEAISDFQNRQTGYDAALKAYSTVQRMSLFEYIR